MDNGRLKIEKIGITLGYIFIIFFISIISMGNHRFRIPPEIQNPLHIPAFTILSILFLQILKNLRIDRWKKVILVIFSSLLVGALNEYIQQYVPGRFSSLEDILRDLVGAIIGIFLFYFFEKSKPSFLKRMICG